MVIYEGTKTILQKTALKDATISLNNGIKMPVIGLGTFRICGRDLIFSVVNSALKAGYRSFDTATVYGNESDIGEALKSLLPKYNLKREDIFITSKLAPKDQGSLRVKQGVEESLSKLGVTYIDLYLIHWPGAANVQIEKSENQSLRRESWEGLVSLQAEGKLKAIGVSNYTARHLTDLLAHSSLPPAVNQLNINISAMERKCPSKRARRQLFDESNIAEDISPSHISPAPSTSGTHTSSRDLPVPGTSNLEDTPSQVGGRTASENSRVRKKLRAGAKVPLKDITPELLGDLFVGEPLSSGDERDVSDEELLEAAFSSSGEEDVEEEVEFHPFFRHPDELLDICGKHNILLQAYSSFGGTGETGLLNNSTVIQISRKLQVQPSQVLLRWALQQGYAIIPKTVNEGRMQENLQLDFVISDEAMDIINNISLRKKYAWDPETVF